MSDSTVSMRHKIDSAEELESVVRTMKAMAASSIDQYENAVRSLDDYYRTVELGLAACFKDDKSLGIIPAIKKQMKTEVVAIVFGSDQGLVGQFNEVIVDCVTDTLDKLPSRKIIWAVGVRLQSRLEGTSLQAMAEFPLPNSINAVTSLVGQILIELEMQLEKGLVDKVYLFHNRPGAEPIYMPVSQQLLPLDETWLHNLAGIRWPTKYLPEVLNTEMQTLRVLVREYLFVMLFRACAESLASENISRLSTMQRAEKNIIELKEELYQTFHRLRQSAIDEELFDVVSGFEALR